MRHPGIGIGISGVGLGLATYVAQAAGLKLSTEVLVGLGIVAFVLFAGGIALELVSGRSTPSRSKHLAAAGRDSTIAPEPSSKERSEIRTLVIQMRRRRVLSAGIELEAEGKAYGSATELLKLVEAARVALPDGSRFDRTLLALQDACNGFRTHVEQRGDGYPFGDELFKLRSAALDLATQASEELDLPEAAELAQKIDLDHAKSLLGEHVATFYVPVPREQIPVPQDLGSEWEATEDGPPGYFETSSEKLCGELRNSGLMPAMVTGAWLDADGQRAVVRTRCDGPHGAGGWASRVSVPPGSVLKLDAALEGFALRADVRPRLYIEYEHVGADTGPVGLTIELLRTGTSAAGKWLWRTGRRWPAVLP